MSRIPVADTDDMHYDGNYRDTSSPLLIRLLDAPSRVFRWTLVPLFRAFDSGGKILYYHEIREPTFRKHIKYINKEYTIVPLDDITSKIHEGETVPNDYVAIVFDDGRRTIYSEVYPVIEELDIPITIYLVTEAINEGIYFWDKVDALQKIDASPNSIKGLAEATPEDRRDLLDEALSDYDITFERTALNWIEIKEMQDLRVSFQCHTKTHPSLPSLDRDSIREEITEATDEIERKLDDNVTHFSYPFGHYSDDVATVVKEIGFESAVGVAAGYNTTETDVYNLRRISAETSTVPLLSSLMEGVWHTIVPGKKFRA